MHRHGQVRGRRHLTHVRHAKYRLAPDSTHPYSRATMTATIGRLFELVLGPTVQTDAEIAQLLGVDLKALQARLVDLTKRGILRGPFEDGPTTRWKSWFPMLQATTEALERSGLRATSSVSLPRAWWNGMWAKE
jgi:hypothetical protein